MHEGLHGVVRAAGANLGLNLVAQDATAGTRAARGTQVESNVSTGWGAMDGVEAPPPRLQLGGPSAQCTLWSSSSQRQFISAGHQPGPGVGSSPNCVRGLAAWGSGILTAG